MDLKENLSAVVVTIISTIVLIIMSIIYFAISLFVIDIAADLVFDASVGTDMAVLSAALLSLGSVVGGALEKKKL